MEFVNNREKPQNKLVVVSSSLQRITMQFAFSVSFIRLGTADVISRLHAMTPFRFQTVQRPRCVTATLLPTPLLVASAGTKGVEIKMKTL
jgi:hypothetical protein